MNFSDVREFVIALARKDVEDALRVMNKAYNEGRLHALLNNTQAIAFYFTNMLDIVRKGKSISVESMQENIKKNFQQLVWYPNIEEDLQRALADVKRKQVTAIGSLKATTAWLRGLPQSLDNEFQLLGQRLTKDEITNLREKSTNPNKDARERAWKEFVEYIARGETAEAERKREWMRAASARVRERIATHADPENLRRLRAARMAAARQNLAVTTMQSFARRRAALRERQKIALLKEKRLEQSELSELKDKVALEQSELKEKRARFQQRKAERAAERVRFT